MAVRQAAAPNPATKNALKHGHYGAESLALRRSIRALLRKARELIDKLE